MSFGGEYRETGGFSALTIANDDLIKTSCDHKIYPLRLKSYQSKVNFLREGDGKMGGPIWLQSWFPYPYRNLATPEFGKDWGRRLQAENLRSLADC
jgi:hypothetical protein